MVKLPPFLYPTDQYTVAFTGPDASPFVCPIVDSSYYPATTLIVMDPVYYNYTFCVCNVGYYGFANNCVKCPPSCTCPGGLFPRHCRLLPIVKSYPSRRNIHRQLLALAKPTDECECLDRQS